MRKGEYGYLYHTDEKMIELQSLKIMNEAMIKLKKEKGLNYLKNIQIEEALEDPSFFSKVPKEIAINVLKEIGIKEKELENSYNDIQNEYKKLQTKKKNLDEFYKEICNYYEESYRIILDPETSDEKLEKNEIEYDPVRWKIEPNIEDYMESFLYDKNLSFEEKILKVYEYICLNYIYDDNVLFFFKKRTDENGNTVYIPVDWYARIVGKEWEEKRKKHNKRVCYEFARFFAKAIEKINDAQNEDINVCVLGLNDNTHYIVGVTGKDYSITLDLDNFNKIKDLTRLKLKLTLEGIVILRDEKNIFTNTLQKYNENRPKDLPQVQKIDNLKRKDFIEYIKEVVDIVKEYKLDPQGFMEYMKEKLSNNEIDVDKVWREVPNSSEKNYVRNLLFEYEGKIYIIDSITQTIKESTKEDIKRNYIINSEEHFYKYYGG